MSVRRFSRRDITRDIKTVAESIHETEVLGQDEVQRDKETHYNLWLLLVAFDEGERYLITWFFPAGLIMSRGYRSRCQSISGFGRHLGRAHLASIPFGLAHVASIPFDWLVFTRDKMLTLCISMCFSCVLLLSKLRPLPPQKPYDITSL